jgi:DNA-binding helix-hairpin-helix protein with protein kinase domain
VDQPPLRKGRVVPRTWIAALGEEVLHEVDLPACCRRSARGNPDDSFECPSCGAMWQRPLPVEPEGCAFGERDMEERRGAA